MSYILQSNPAGIAELARATKQGRIVGNSLKGIFRSSEIARIRTEPQTRNSANKPTLFGHLMTQGFLFDALVNDDTLDFGMQTKGQPAISLSKSFYCSGDGKVTMSLSGSSAFKINVVKTDEYVSNGGGSGYEKVVEYSGSSFPADSGLHYTVYLQFNAGNMTGPQNGKLTIKEPGRTIELPLKGSGQTKQLAVTVDGVQQSTTQIMPMESVDATVNMTVKQNTGSQLYFKLLTSVKGVKLDADSKWVGKAGSTSQKLRLRTDADLVDTAKLSVPIGIYAVGSDELLSSFTLSFGVRREWIEWDYTDEVGNQTIRGLFQLSSTGEFIWSVDAHNSSSLFSDTLFSAFCFPGLYPQGKSPGCMWSMPLPAGGHASAHWQYTGTLVVSDFQAMKSMKIRHYLALNEGGPLAALEGAGSGFVDMIKGVFSDDKYDQIPNNFGGMAIKWIAKNKFVSIKRSTSKLWW